MSGVGIVVLLVVGVVVVVLLGLAISFNRFARLGALVEESWHDIDVELTRRHDLVPNLVATVQGYATHERAALEGLTRSRAQATAHRSDPPAGRTPYEDALGGALSGVLARAEAYPDLRASSGFRDLQVRLTDTEDRIAAARRFYNANVRRWNQRVVAIPSSLVAAMAHHRRRDFFELADPADAAPPEVRL